MSLPVPETLELGTDDAARLGIESPALRLERAWPRGPGRLLVDYAASDGVRVAGQWQDSLPALARNARETEAASRAGGVALVDCDGGGLLLQGGGADRRLPSLASLATEQCVDLLVHRAESRGVVRVTGNDEVRFARVVPRRRLPALVTGMRAAERLESDVVSVPRLLSCDDSRGLIELSALDGESLHELLIGDRPAPLAEIGAAIQAIHTAPTPAGLRRHGAEEEARVVRGWLEALRKYAPDVFAEASARATFLAHGLPRAPAATSTIHRDLHDRQLVLSPDGRVGVLDFDTLALGDPALDLANLLVHLELRGLQCHSPPERTRDQQDAILRGYAPAADLRRRLDGYADAARLRLTCVYALRPRWRHLVPRLLDGIGAPLPRAVCRGQ